MSGQVQLGAQTLKKRGRPKGCSAIPVRKNHQGDPSDKVKKHENDDPIGKSQKSHLKQRGLKTALSGGEAKRGRAKLGVFKTSGTCTGCTEMKEKRESRKKQIS